jgi:serine/threonine protein kinase
MGSVRLSVRVDLGDPAPLFLGLDAGAPVLIRNLAPTARPSARWRRDFMERGTAAVGLEHPQLLAVREVSVSRGRPFVAYEPRFGVGLRRVLEAGPLAPRQWAQLGLDLLAALRFLHENGLPSGTVHPDRVWATFDERFLLVDPTLGDFSPVATTAAAHRPYRAPELTDETSPPTMAADRYALGVLLEVARPPDLTTRALEDLMAADPARRTTSHLEAELEVLRHAAAGPSVRDRFRRLYTLIHDALQRAPSGRPTAAMGPVAAGAGPVAGAAPATACGPHRLGPRIGGSRLRPLYATADAPELWIKLDGSGEAQHLRAEKQRLSNLCGLPGVPEVVEAQLDGPAPYLVLRGAPVRSLQPLVGGPMHEGVQFLARLGATLGALHDRNACFGHLHLNSLAQDADGRPQLLDWTAIGIRDRSESALALAPENLVGRPYDARSEGFAFGSFAYHCLTGVRPHRGSDPDQLGRAMAAGRIRPPNQLDPRIPRGLSDTLVALLDPEPATRLPLGEATVRLAALADATGALAS